MAFTLSGTLITQTGTDNNLAGLANIAGVTTSNKLTYTEYDIGQMRLLIQGTLNIATGSREQLVYQGDTGHNNVDIQIEPSAELNIGAFDSNPLNYNYQDHIPAIVEKIIPSQLVFQTSNGFQSDGQGQASRRTSLWVRGTLNSYARTVLIANFGLAQAGIMNIQYSRWIYHASSYAYGTNLAILNSEFNGFSFVANGDYLSLNGWVSRTGVLNFSNSTPAGAEYNVKNVADLNEVPLASSGLINVNAPTGIATNLETGTAQRYTTTAGRYWNVKLRRELAFNVKSDAGEIIENATTYIVGSSGTQAVNVTDAQGRHEKTFEFATRQAISGVVQPYTFFTKNADETDDLVDTRVIQYNRQISAQNNVSLRGLNRLELNFALIPDSNITEPSKAVADAYTELETSKKVYDRAKCYLIDNYEGQTEVIVSLIGETLNLGDYNLVVDDQATEAFAVSGETITIKASNFTSNVTSNRTVTSINGATISGSISDSNGDSNLTATVPTGYENDIEVYTNQADAQSQTNAVANGSSFRYSSSSFGGLTLWFRMTQEDGSFIIENYIVPASAGNYEVSLVVTSENSALGAIKAVTDKLDAMLSIAEGEQVFKTEALKNLWQVDISNITESQKAGKQLRDAKTKANLASVFSA